jgi:hypothetical protein
VARESLPELPVPLSFALTRPTARTFVDNRSDGILLGFQMHPRGRLMQTPKKPASAITYRERESSVFDVVSRQPFCVTFILPTVLIHVVCHFMEDPQQRMSEWRTESCMQQTTPESLLEACPFLRTTAAPFLIDFSELESLWL